MASSIPHPIQVGVGTHVVPPAALLVMSTVTFGGQTTDGFKKKLFLMTDHTNDVKYNSLNT